MIFGRKAIPAWLVLSFGLAVTAVSAFEVKRDIDRDVANLAGYEADRIALKFQERLETYALILRAADGLFAASDRVTRQEWQRFAETLRIDTQLPGIQGVGFAEWISPDRLAEHEARVRAEGFSGYRVWPEGRRPVYTAIVYLEPFRDRNLRAFGYDMYAEPVRREAMDRAADRAESALSGKVTLVQETDTDVQAGVLMYHPIYRNGMPTETVAQRRAALEGWTFMTLRMNDLVMPILQEWYPHGLPHLHIYDGNEASSGRVLFDGGKPAHGHGAGRVLQTTITFGDRSWLLEFRSEQPTVRELLPAWITFGAGAAISALAFMLTIALLDRQNQARALAEELTADLRRNEAALREAENRWRAALEGSGLGVWDWNVPEGKVFYSRLAKALFGYTEDEIGTGVEEWESRIHPDDKAETLAHMNARLDGKTSPSALRYRLRCKDGSYKWAFDRSTVFERDANGKPVRIVGTVADITSQVRAERIAKEYLTYIEAMIGGMVNAISVAVELRDPYTAGHERRVGELSAAIAAEMGLDEKTQRGLRYAGAVHDVGKIAVPADILSKPGRLTPIEFEIVKGHATQGYEVLKDIDSPWPLAEVARQHHERVDGSGYPRGLKGEQIILEARILAVADVIEAMASHRPYRPALGLDKALAEIETHKGTLYDTRAAEACLALFRSGRFAFDRPPQAPQQA